MSRQYAYRVFRDGQGKSVRLSMARWRHIQRKHPEVSEDDLLQTLAEPESIEENSKGHLYRRRGKGGVVTVAVKEARGRYVRTAYVAPAIRPENAAAEAATQRPCP